MTLGFCALLATSLPPTRVGGHPTTGTENHVVGGQEALMTLTPEPVEATLTPIRTPESTSEVRRPTATPTPTASYTPQEASHVEPTSTALFPEPPQSEPADCDSVPMSILELDLFDSINSERLLQGLIALKDHLCGRIVAEVRAVDLATRNYFSHQSPNGETATSLLRARGIDFSAAGENLARNNYPVGRSVDVAIDSLMDSELHRQAILDRSYTHLGVAFSEDEAGMKYYVMIFIRF